MTSSTLRNQAYEFIRGKLVRGELQPGQRLSNRKIADEIGMSFIPVREAISQLASEGLIEHRPNLGAFVMQASRDEIEELYDFREAMECHAASVAVGKISSQDLSAMHAHNEQLKSIAQQLSEAGAVEMDHETNDRWVFADAAFHMALLRAAGNRRIIRTVKSLRMMTYIFGYRRKSRPLQSLHRVCREHDEILHAMESGDGESARRAMAEHIQQGQKIALVWFDQRRVAEAAGEMAADVYSAELQYRIRNLETD